MFSEAFQRLYCDSTVYDPFSRLHPISFARVLPFQPDDPVLDDPAVLGAEAAHLAGGNELTRGEVIDAYARCGLLSPEGATGVKSVIDFYDGAGFFDLMGLVYANAGMFICALRWYRELIRVLETPRPAPGPGINNEDVHASAGYCLYALGLFEEAIAWTKSCAGPRLLADAQCETLLDREAQQAGGRLRAVERASGRARYTLSASDPVQAGQGTPRLKVALKAFAPWQESYLDWIGTDALLASRLGADASPADSGPLFDPVKIVLEGSDLSRHKLNLLFASYARAEALIEAGDSLQAKQLLIEAALVEPAAVFIQERLKTLASDG
jgi:tetratricopeptide (TPR) repeat protein